MYGPGVIESVNEDGPPAPETTGATPTDTPVTPTDTPVTPTTVETLDEAPPPPVETLEAAPPVDEPVTWYVYTDDGCHYA